MTKSIFKLIGLGADNFIDANWYFCRATIRKATLFAINSCWDSGH